MLAAAVTVALMVTATAGSTADAADVRDGALRTWLRHRAVPVHDGGDAGHTRFARALEHAVGDAQVVGLGEAVHGAHEIAALKQQAVKVLVTRLGFRSLAWEEDWTTGRAIDRYLRTGDGDPTALVGRMTGEWRSRETLRVLEWLRSYNVRHSDPVRFTGVEYYYTGRSAYDTVKRYVRAAAPRVFPQVRRDLNFLRPTMRKKAYATWYAGLQDKEPYVNHAHELFHLVSKIQHSPAEHAHALALHAARQILWFYEHYDRTLADQARFREPRSARNLSWWQRRSGDRVMYWAATPHTAVAPRLRISTPGPDFRYASAGSFLERRYGHDYTSIGVTFDHGSVGLPPEHPITMPPPDPRWFESKLAAVHRHAFVVDLRSARPFPEAVRQWLRAPLVTRGLPQAGPTSSISGGSVGRWFDALIHVRVVHPQRTWAAQGRGSTSRGA
jgi:erythromycin esterase-like protein